MSHDVNPDVGQVLKFFFHQKKTESKLLMLRRERLGKIEVTSAKVAPTIQATRVVTLRGLLFNPLTRRTYL